ncbi:MAG: hypothetical protein IT385_06000 [Deltaproteobacteria bacterium]|nr:hypothetical protein [Deltaproteobacteria bacterium]
MEKASRMEDALTTRAEAAWRDALEQLEVEGRRHAGAILAAPSIPDDFAAMLRRALAEPEAWPGEHALLVGYHTTTLQEMRARVLAVSDEPQRTLCHTPLDLAAMPRLARALASLFALVRDADVDPARAFGAASPEALVAARPTLAALFAGSYFGSYGPPLYLQPPDLASLARELETTPALEVIDKRLTSPLVHELSHLSRARSSLAPPYMDECVAAFLGELAWPSIAVPAPGEDDALYLAGWFTQVGAHLDRLIGRRALVRAHAGVDPWESALPPGLAARLAELGWRQWISGRHLSFLGETHRPDPWIKALWLGAGRLAVSAPTLESLDALPWSEVPRGPWTAADDALVAHAITTLGTEPLQTPEGAWRVRRAPCAVRFDLETNRLVRDGVRHPLEQPHALHLVMPPGYRPA